MELHMQSGARVARTLLYGLAAAALVFLVMDLARGDTWAAVTMFFTGAGALLFAQIGKGRDG